jgi:hypothetical protein
VYDFCTEQARCGVRLGSRAVARTRGTPLLVLPASRMSLPINTRVVSHLLIISCVYRLLQQPWNPVCRGQRSTAAPAPWSREAIGNRYTCLFVVACRPLTAAAAAGWRAMASQTAGEAPGTVDHQATARRAIWLLAPSVAGPVAVRRLDVAAAGGPRGLRCPIPPSSHRAR